MPDRQERGLTPREVAELAAVPMRAVEKAIEEKVLEVRTGSISAARDNRVAKSRRLLGIEGVAYLAIMRGLATDVTLSISAKRMLVETLRGLNPAGIARARVELAPEIVLDVAGPAGEAFRRAEAYLDDRDRWIESVPGVQGGLPVIKGTRITVHSLGARVAHGESVEDVVEDYSMIPREAICVGILFAKCHPLTGRPSGLARQSAA